uniref:Uncharacterized protein n=1 Tax=Anguilla anguilla TaxID=7936 RepID=A0A0E9PK29_ANGAN
MNTNTKYCKLSKVLRFISSNSSKRDLEQ